MLYLNRLVVCIVLSAVVSCQINPNKKAEGRREAGSVQNPQINAEMMLVKFYIPALSEFKSNRGDATGLATHFAYRIEARDAECASAQKTMRLNYAGPREERVLVPRLCVLRIAFALGNVLPAIGDPFQVLYQTNQAVAIEPQIWLNAREAAINYTMNRSAAGQAAGFVTTDVNVYFPATTGLPSNQVNPNPNPNGGITYPPSGNVTPTNPTVPTNPTTDSRYVDFRIRAGTGNGPWNDASTKVIARVGQTVRIYNDDNVVHQLHTDGLPCQHGNPIRPGAFGECVIQRAYNGQALYDHNTRGAFFIGAQ